MFERVITVTRKSELQELVERFGTVPQARFYLEHAGHDFARVQAAHDTYMFALDEIRNMCPAISSATPSTALSSRATVSKRMTWWSLSARTGLFPIRQNISMGSRSWASIRTRAL